MDLLTAMKYQVYMQQFLLLAPYRIEKGRAVLSTFMTWYIWLSVILFFGISLLIGQNARNGDLVQMQFENGYIWGIIATFELSFSNLSYPLLVSYLWMNRKRQIRFLNSIADIDEVLQREFGLDMAHFNARGQKRGLTFIMSTVAYFWGLWLLWFFYLIPRSYLASKGLMFLVVANQFQQSSMGLLTMEIVIYCRLIRFRFDMLLEIDLKAILSMSDEKQRRRMMATWLTLFRDLCRTIEQINDHLGLVIAWRYSHDFTLLISQLYLVYCILDRGGSGIVILCVVYWAFQNVIKLYGIGMSAHSTTRTMRNCSAKANTLNTIGVDRVVKQMLDSFGLWILHHKVEFTANNLFTVDLTLVYAVVGALASYLLILIQFKQQEESMIQIYSNVTLSSL